MRKPEEMTPRPHNLQDEKNHPSNKSARFQGANFMQGDRLQGSISSETKDQVFCSPGCRSEYFKVARGIGVALLERSKRDSKLRVIVDGLLDALKNPI